MLPERVAPEPPPAVLAGHERVRKKDALRLDVGRVELGHAQPVEVL